MAGMLPSSELIAEDPRGRPMAAESQSDAPTLARRAAAGCVASFSELARRYQVPVVHYVQQLAGPGGDAEDVALDDHRASRRRGDGRVVDHLTVRNKLRHVLWTPEGI